MHACSGIPRAVCCFALRVERERTRAWPVETVRMARIAVALACAASCCAMFTVNERAAHTDAHVKPMDTVGRLITLDERPREMTITPARVCVVIEDKRAGCSCIAGGERAADAEDAEQTPRRLPAESASPTCRRASYGRSAMFSRSFSSTATSCWPGTRPAAPELACIIDTARSAQRPNRKDAIWRRVPYQPREGTKRTPHTHTVNMAAHVPSRYKVPVPSY